jgi:hypothetical protein
LGAPQPHPDLRATLATPTGSLGSIMALFFAAVRISIFIEIRLGSDITNLGRRMIELNRP